MIAIDLYYLMLINIPIRLKNELLLAFIEVTKNVIVKLYNQFYDHFNLVKYDLTFTAQVISLEHLLNDYYDNTLRRIYIDDELDEINIFLFNKSEDNEDTYLFNKSENQESIYIFNDAELKNIKDFIIYIPSDVIYSVNQLTRLVDTYKSPGKQYSIEII
jgi:hypothetical protein